MKKRGFTLIELLAVIIILAIIALIAIPAVTNIIEDAKKEASKTSALGFIEAVENQVSINDLTSSNQIFDNVYDTDTLQSAYEVTVKGTKPSTGSWVKIENGEVSCYSLKEDNYVVSKDCTSLTETTEKTDTIVDRPASSDDNTLYGMIKKSALTDTIDFAVNSGTSGTNGVYITTETDSGNPVYYYRGSYTALNNNLIFNNMCWKIIRTTETGGVKIIYNGTPTDGKCETQTGETTQVGYSKFNEYEYISDNAYVGYMYGTARSTTYEATHANINDSTIKTYIDNWYTTNFDADTTAKLEDTVFCNDRSTVSDGVNNTLDSSIYGTLGYGQEATGYGVSARASYYTSTLSPSLKCTNANDKFTVSATNGNGKLTNPVGLITLDEVVLAGLNTSASDNSNYADTTNYLQTNSSYWTLSPVIMTSTGNARVGISGESFVNDLYVNTTYGVRPVVSLISGTLVTGEGSTTNPYVVQ